ncbi:MAG: ATP cone domain-containing protein [Planctomycetota bacterium]
MAPLRQIRKRDGRLVPFERGKIAEAIFRAAQAVGGEDRFLADQLAGVVEARVAARVKGVPTIEDVQDAVEKVLIEAGHARTAKTFILYRERRSEVRAGRGRVARRAQRERAPVEESSGPVPLVGGDPAPGQPADEASLSRLDKAAIAADLRAQLGLARAEAEAVARAVEERVVRSGRARIGRATLEALIHAELFDRGLGEGEIASLGGTVPADEVDAWLERGMTARRAPQPAALAEAAGEALFARHLLDHRLPTAVAEAHRVGDIHLYDLGAPHRLTAIGLDAVAVAERALEGDLVSTARRAGRALAALESVALSYGPHAARVLALDHVNLFLAPFLASLGDEAMRERLRELLLAPVWSAVPGRGGLVRVEWVLRSEVPPWLHHRHVPAPAPPGLRYGDLADEALRVTRLLLQETAALQREGRWVDVGLTVVVPREKRPDAATRALVREALRTAVEGGEPLVVLEGRDAVTRGSRWLRRTEAEAPDPLRFPHGDVTVASVGAVNLVAAALRSRGLGERELEREVERLVGLVLDAAVLRRELLESVGDEPGGPLWALRRGAHPLVDLEAAVHAVQLVGLDPAVALFSPSPRERQALRARLVERAVDEVARQSAARRVAAVVVEERDPEASARFARVDAERYPEVAGWWADDLPPTYRRGAGPSAAVVTEVVQPGLGEGPPRLRVRHRVRSDDKPPMERLLHDVEGALGRPDVVELAIDPWPRRTVRRGDDEARVGTSRHEGMSGDSTPGDLFGDDAFPGEDGA